MQRLAEYLSEVLNLQTNMIINAVISNSCMMIEQTGFLSLLVTRRESQEPEINTIMQYIGEALQLSPSQTPTSLASLDEEGMTPDQQQCRNALRNGKGFLKGKNGGAAMVRFEKALMLSKGMNDSVQERRAMRGLAAAARLQVNFS